MTQIDTPDQLQLTESDRQQLATCKRAAPFREWFVVKCEKHCTFHNSKPAAKKEATRRAPAAIYKA